MVHEITTSDGTTLRRQLWGPVGCADVWWRAERNECKTEWFRSRRDALVRLREIEQRRRAE